MTSSDLKMSKQHEILQLTSNPKNVARVEPFVEQMFKQYDISPEIYGNILISLTEAVTNAITHGNHNDESKNVFVRTRFLANKVCFLVTDEGPGFDHDNLPDPTAPENLLKIGGRGVFLMKQLSDNIIYSDDGRTVEIHFKV